MTEPLYSFDTSALINGRRDLLPPGIFITLWQRVEVMIAAGPIRCVDVVKTELGRRADAIYTWALAQNGLFVELEQDIQIATSEVLREHRRLVGKGGLRNAADPFVIGLARARRGAVVTEEHATGNLEKPHIPDVCAAMGVRCIGLVEFIGDQGWTF